MRERKQQLRRQAGTRDGWQWAAAIAAACLAMPVASHGDPETPKPEPQAPVEAPAQPPARPESPREAPPTPPGPAATAPPNPAAPDPTADDPSVPEMTLEEAIAYAVRNNPRVAGAAALIREARGRVTQRRALRYPQLGVNNFVFRQGPVVPGFSPGSPPSVPPYRYNVGVFLSQVVFDWGQRRANQRAAERDVEAAGLRLGETQNDVRLVVGTTYFNVLRGEELVEVAEERVRSTTEQLRVSRARFESDLAPRFDVIRSEAELAAAQQELIEARNEVSLAEAALNTALGREVTTPVRLQRTPLPTLPDIPFATLREAALRSRPQLQALEKDIQAGRELVRGRRAENRPQVGLSSAYDRPNPGGFAPQSYRYNAGLVMTFPFFDAGLTRGRVREAQATVEADQQELIRARQQVELDLRQAQLDLGEAQQRISAAGTEQASAREALRVAEVRYRAGVGTNVEVTDAQVAVARAGQNLANAQFDYLTALVRLENATGAPIAPLVSPPASPAAPATEPAPATPAPATPAAPAPVTPANPQ